MAHGGKRAGAGRKVGIANKYNADIKSMASSDTGILNPANIRAPNITYGAKAIF